MLNEYNCEMLLKFYEYIDICCFFFFKYQPGDDKHKFFKLFKRILDDFVLQNQFQIFLNIFNHF